MEQPAKPDRIAAELIAVLVAVADGQPRVMTVGNGRTLPSGPFAAGHRSLQSGLRDWVEQQTRHPLGYIEQLYTFGDSDRAGDDASRMISISYLALVREDQAAPAGMAGWRDWYHYLPWEDHRKGLPAMLDETIIPHLERWVGDNDDRRQRTDIAFGLSGHGWNEEQVLQRYELLYEAGLVQESRDTRPQDSAFGLAMDADHRRILATAIARLRGKIKYRPVVFELLPPAFTLLQLQRSVEALAGRLVHKQNFRRLIEQQELVEETGDVSTETGGRPAKLFRFRHGVLAERSVAGTRLPLSRS